VITDIEGVKDEANNLLMYNWESQQSPVDSYFLTNVVYCRGLEESDSHMGVSYTITGTMVTMEEFKQAVADYLAANGLDAVLYNMHGYNNGPGWAFNEYGLRFQTYYQDLTKWLLIPIMWRNPWEADGGQYLSCRRGPALRGGKIFAASVDVFKAPYTTYMMTHSMGNYVYQVFATTLCGETCRLRRSWEPEYGSGHGTGATEKIFEKHFMVAANVPDYLGIFTRAYNPDAPRSQEEAEMNIMSSPHTSLARDMLPIKKDESTHVSLKDDYDPDGYNWRGVPIEEYAPNAGYSITLMAEKVHVLWNSRDMIPSFIPVEVFSGIINGMTKDAMDLEYFERNVIFHDNMDSHGVIENHSYQMEPASIKEYYPQLSYECEWTPCIGTDAPCELPAVQEATRTCLQVFTTNHCCVFSHTAEEKIIQAIA